jgi:acyl carrier protein
LPGPQPVDHLVPPTDAAPSQEAVLIDLRRMIIEVIGEDYITDTEIGLDTSFYEELEIESIEFVALGEALQEHYGDRVDFAAWIATLEVDDIIAMTVGRLTEHIVVSLASDDRAVAGPEGDDG